jgi:hypothetical protein
LTDGRSYSDALVGWTVWSTTCEQLGRQRVQVELLAQARAEGLDGPGRVVAAPVEASVHGVLDAAAGRLEHGGDC